jgi:hypothetical protein
MELVKNFSTFAQLAWTEFQTQFQVLGPSLKLSLSFFLRLYIILKIKHNT